MSKTVVITGGTRGIGWGISTVFMEAGWQVVCGARSQPSQDKSFLGPFHFIAMDACSVEGQENLINAALKKTGRIDAFVNCAGISQWKPLKEIDEKFLDNMINLNIKGYFWGCRAAAAVMPQGSSIINISSLAGKRGSSNNAAYCATKFAVNGLTQSLAKELGPTGIRVNALCPVYVETDMIIDELSNPHSPASGHNVGEYLNNFTEQQTALKRLPEPKDVGEAALYLAEERSKAITGQCINIDCGVLPQ